MKTLLVLVLLLLARGTFVSAQAHEFPDTSGNAFARLCSVIDKDVETMIHTDYGDEMACLGYVSGFVNGVEFEAGYAEAQAGRKLHKPFCRPDDTENGQLIRIVLKYIRDNPEEAHHQTAVLVMNALAKAYPCK